jgi:hypothetical protein
MPIPILEVLAANLAFAVVALALGELMLRLAEAGVGAPPRPPSLQRLGAALLTGFGGCGLAGIGLAAAHLFRWQAFAVCGAVVLVVARGHLAAYARASRRFLSRAPSAGPFVLVPVAVAVVLAAAQWLAALAPPEAFDELAYHLPEARVLADSHVLHLTLSSHRVGTGIYGNLPTLAETLFGEGLTVHGTDLAHALHLSLIVAFAVLAAGVVRPLWGAQAAAFAVGGIALYPDLMGYAVTGYIDPAATAFEVGAVLLFVLWAVRGNPGDAAVGALLLGFAAAVKYTALPTALLVAILVAVVAVRARERRLPVALAAIALAGCAYWYGKNLIRFGNPLYPFAFGHPGISDALYQGWLQSVHQFGSRTISTFLDTPSRFASDASIVPFLAFALAPLALFAQGSRRAAALLLLYAISYAAYWFWLGSSQTRFLMSAVVVAIILAAVALGAARGLAGVAAVALVALAVTVGEEARHHPFNANARGVPSVWLDTQKSRYALGLETKNAYLHHFFGCEVDAVDLLAARHLHGAVALWWLATTPDYPRDNRLAPIHVPPTTPAGVRRELRRQGFRFALTEGTSIADLSSYSVVQKVLLEARPFWHSGDCTLYRLSLGASGG